MSKPPRNHHFLPIFYQSRWSGPDDRIVRYSQVHNLKIVSRRVFPRQAGWQRDLYRHPGKSGDDWSAQELESETLSVVDAAAARALNTLLNDQSAIYSEETKLSWFRFMRSLLHRSPQNMRATLSKLEEIWWSPTPDVQQRYEKVRGIGFPATVEEFLTTLNPHEPRDAAYRIFSETLERDRLAEYVLSIQWLVIDCRTAEFRFLLSDNPVILAPLELPLGHFAIPLSPTKLLVASRHPAFFESIEGLSEQQLVRSANKLVVQRAYHCVIAPDLRQDVFVRRNFGVDRNGSFADAFAGSVPPAQNG